MTWYAKPTYGYTADSVEGRANATNIVNTFLSLQTPWDLKSICAMLGNGAGEGGLNPWSWEDQHIPTYNEFLSWSEDEEWHHGYGIFGFTPAKSYINSENSYLPGYAPNFLDRPGNASDGEAQTRFMTTWVERNWLWDSQWQRDYYGGDFALHGRDIDDYICYNYNEYITAKSNGNDISLAILTGAFMVCFEKPSAIDTGGYILDYRVQQAEAWYDYFSDNPPTPPTPTPTTTKMPLWMKIKPIWKLY